MKVLSVCIKSLQKNEACPVFGSAIPVTRICNQAFIPAGLETLKHEQPSTADKNRDMN